MELIGAQNGTLKGPCMDPVWTLFGPRMDPEILSLQVEILAVILVD